MTAKGSSPLRWFGTCSFASNNPLIGCTNEAKRTKNIRPGGTFTVRPLFGAPVTYRVDSSCKSLGGGGSSSAPSGLPAIVNAKVRGTWDGSPRERSVSNPKLPPANNVTGDVTTQDAHWRQSVAQMVDRRNVGRIRKARTDVSPGAAASGARKRRSCTVERACFAVPLLFEPIGIGNAPSARMLPPAPSRLAAIGALTTLSLGCGAASRTVSEGIVAPGFERVRVEFDRNLRERDEKGAAIAVYQRGQLVVDLWGGDRGQTKGPWRRDTLVPVYSTTKGVAALLIGVAVSRGWLRYEARVAEYWPEFAQNGKAEITVRQLLSHEAGLVLLDQEVPYEMVRDLDSLAPVLARQKPRWEPGTRHGYHLSTLGFYMNELFRRVEPRRRSIGQVLREDLATVLPGELYVGVPSTLDTQRVAHVETTSPVGGLMHLTDPPFAILTRMLSPWSVMTQTFGIPKGYDVNDPKWWQVEMPSGNGIANARAIAWMYGAFANGGRELALKEGVLAALEAPAIDPPKGPHDEVLGTDSYYGLGFIKPSNKLEFGSSQRAYGMPGAGGSFAFADPDEGIGYAYVMNRMGYHMSDDPRELALRAAVYACLEVERRGEREHLTPGSR